MNWIALWRLAKPFLPLLGGVALILAAIAWVDHRGYERAERDAERRWQEQIAIAAAETKRIEAAISKATAQIEDKTGQRIDGLQQFRQNLIVNLAKDISDDPRYRDTACSLTARVRESIQSARAKSAVRPAANVVVLDLPAAAPTQ